MFCCDHFCWKLLCLFACLSACPPACLPACLSVEIVRKASQIDGYAASVREERKERNTQRNDYQEDMRPTVYLLFLNTLEDGVQKLAASC